MRRVILPAVPNPPDPPCDHWLPIVGTPPPRDATWLLLLVLVGRPNVSEPPVERLVRAHWAHGGGEDQPPFGPGWFEDWYPNAFQQVAGRAVAWRPLTGQCVRCHLVLPPYEKGDLKP